MYQNGHSIFIILGMFCKKIQLREVWKPTSLFKNKFSSRIICLGIIYRRQMIDILELPIRIIIIRNVVFQRKRIGYCGAKGKVWFRKPVVLCKGFQNFSTRKFVQKASSMAGFILKPKESTLR